MGGSRFAPANVRQPTPWAIRPYCPTPGTPGRFSTRKSARLDIALGDHRLVRHAANPMSDGTECEPTMSSPSWIPRSGSRSDESRSSTCSRPGWLRKKSGLGSTSREIRSPSTSVKQCVSLAPTRRLSSSHSPQPTGSSSFQSPPLRHRTDPSPDPNSS